MFRKAAELEQTSSTKTTEKWLKKLNKFELPLEGNDVNCVAVSDEKNCFLIGSKQGIFVFDKSTFTITKTLTTNSYFVPFSLSFSPDGKNFICWDNGSAQALLWNLEDQRYRVVFDRSLENFISYGSYEFIFIDANKVMAITTKDFYFETGDGDIDNPERRKTHISYLNLINGKIEGEWLLEKEYNEISLVSGNRLLCSSGSKKCVDLYDIQDKKLIKTLAVYFPVSKAKLSNNQKYLFCSGQDDSVVAFNFETMTYDVKQFTVSSSEVNDFSISSDDKYLAVAEYATGKKREGNVLYFDIETEECLARFPCGKYLKYLFMDHSKQTLFAIDNNFVNSIKYKANFIPSLEKMCISQIKKEPIFFQNKTLTKKEVRVLKQYLDIEENSEEVKTQSSNKNRNTF